MPARNAHEIVGASIRLQTARKDADRARTEGLRDFGVAEHDLRTAIDDMSALVGRTEALRLSDLFAEVSA
jgi:hypothetical protein